MSISIISFWISITSIQKKRHWHRSQDPAMSCPCVPCELRHWSRWEASGRPLACFAALAPRMRKEVSMALESQSMDDDSGQPHSWKPPYQPGPERAQRPSETAGWSTKQLRFRHELTCVDHLSPSKNQVLSAFKLTASKMWFIYYVLTIEHLGLNQQKVGIVSANLGLLAAMVWF